uniref:Laminin EGF-like domain-containing protein n=1 Tax=Biomphalaria glabrata TaxID=6526 RepID=A0A2C9LGX3_BIOGL
SGCTDGTWGPSCQNNCSSNCFDVICDGSNGSCLLGCKEGYQTDYCSVQCDRNHYGRNCLLKCSSTCFNDTCNSTNGFCDTCFPGYQGDFCNHECNETLFGQDCKLSCNTSCLNQLCDPFNGTCLQCESGRAGDQCDDCPAGKYGLECKHECSPTCKNGCQPVDGNCKDGCHDGFQGRFCNETCDENHFGPACSSACNLHCEVVSNNNSRICHNVNGSCLLGCSRDFTGPQCSEAINSGSSPPVGAIVGAAIAALVIIALIIVAVVLWRRKHPKKERTSFKERNITHLILPEKNVEEKVSEEIETPKEDDDPGFIPDATYYNTSSEPLVNISMPVHELNIYMKSHDKEFFTEQFKV